MENIPWVSLPTSSDHTASPTHLLVAANLDELESQLGERSTNSVESLSSVLKGGGTDTADNQEREWPLRAIIQRGTVSYYNDTLWLLSSVRRTICWLG